MLVVTADDLGLSEAVDRGVLIAHREGVVRSASLLVTFPRAEEAVALAREERDLEVGLHIDLVEGTPVSDPRRIPSLVGPNGRFRGIAQLLRGVTTGSVRAGEVAEEVRAQADRARSLGAPALAWDSHRHVHLWPPLARVIGAVAREKGARWLRRAVAPTSVSGLKPRVLSLASFASSPFLRGVPGGRWYVETSWPHCDAAQIALLAALPGVVEVAGHPAAGREAADDPIAQLRPRDLRLLTDPLLRDALGRDAVRWRVPRPG